MYRERFPAWCVIVFESALDLDVPTGNSATTPVAYVRDNPSPHLRLKTHLVSAPLGTPTPNNLFRHPRTTFREIILGTLPMFGIFFVHPNPD